MKYRDQFKSKHIVFPVIHVETLDQALRNVETAQQAGANQVFLINHRIKPTPFGKIGTEVHNRFPDLWLGVNILGQDALTSMVTLPDYVQGLWVDDAHIDQDSEIQTAAEEIQDMQKVMRPNLIYFGGTAFKYQKYVPPEKLAFVAGEAAHLTDVITTSGEGTGIEADVDKIRIMKKAAGDSPVAIASGITSDNIERYMPYADAFLVATGISKDDFNNIDFDLTKQLINKIS